MNAIQNRRLNLFARLFLFASFFVVATAQASMKGSKRADPPLGQNLKKLQPKPKVHRDEPQTSPLVKALRQELGGTFENSVLTITFLERTIPIKIIERKTEVEFLLDGMPPCLDFLVHLKKQTGFIRQIYTDGNHCPFLGEQAGTLILKLAQALGSSLKLREIALYDSSEIRSKNGSLATSLRFLRTVLKDYGWYESHGYLPVPSLESAPATRDGFYLKYRQQVELFQNYSLLKILDNLTELDQVDLSALREYFFEQEWPKIKSELENSENDPSFFRVSYESYFDKIPDSVSALRGSLSDYFEVHSEDSLGVFLKWLWHHDQSKYIRTLDFLFPLEGQGLEIDLGLGTYDLFPAADLHIKKL